jgi:hypothetical protein
MSPVSRGGRGMGRGAGAAPGRGRTGGGRGRMGGPAAAGATGVCRCTSCGHTQPHERGVPCIELKCPQCGAGMIRQ